MSSRVAGASLALIAAALLAVSVATPVVLPPELSLLAGHPTIKGHTLELQDVYVGFYGAELCNTGGDGTCRSRDPQTSFRLTAFAELGVTALLGASSIVLALLTLRKSERRKGAATLVRLAAVLAAAGAGALIYLGPTDEGTIPIGLGMWLYGGGVLGALLASFVAARPPPPIKLRVAGHGKQPVASLRPQPATAGAAPFDKQTLFQDDQLRPSDLGPEPMMGRDGRTRAVPPSSSDFPGASGGFPTAPPTPEKPLFSAAPQLRPLYDAAPQQGGTGGLLPIERPVMPTRPPTPIARGSVHVAGEIPPTPPLPDRAKPKTLPPPMRSKPPSVAPPISNEPPQPPASSFVSPPSRESFTSLTGELPFTGPPTNVLPAPPTISPLVDQLINAPPAGAPPAGGPPPVPSAAMQIPIVPAPRTQVSLVPPMPDNDPPIAPPTAQMARARFETPASSSDFESSSFPRVETPIAPPPSPIAPAPPRETKPPRAAVRATVPMPARPGRSTSGPIRPPIPPPPPGRTTIPPPRPTISHSVPPPPGFIPPIPAIPAIPAIPKRLETDVTDPDGRAPHDDVDQPTIARVPAEILDNTSKTNVSYGMPTAEEIDAAVDEAGASRDLPGDVHGGADIDDAIVTTGHPRIRRSELGFGIDTPPSPPPVMSQHDAEEAVTVRAPPKAYPSSLPTVPFAAVMPPSDAPELPTTPAFRDRLMPNVPLSTAPDSLPPPKDSKHTSGPSPACPQCESPMAWVEEHLRFYCKSCRMYF